MTYNECLTFIHSLDRFGSVPGIERISELLELLSNPQDKLKFIHVAGTNGKGSVTMYCASVLKKAGYSDLWIELLLLDDNRALILAQLEEDAFSFGEDMLTIIHKIFEKYLALTHK